MRMEKLLPINNCVNGKFLKFAIDNKIFRFSFHVSIIAVVV